MRSNLIPSPTCIPASNTPQSSSTTNRTTAHPWFAQFLRQTAAAMSSQDNKGIPLQHGPTGVGYKLLELPPEVLALLESDNPPV